MKRFIFALGLVTVALAGAVPAGPPKPSDLRPLTTTPPTGDETGRLRPQAEGQPLPLFYYNGDEKRYLFDTGLAVAKVKPNVGLTNFAARPEVVTPPQGSALADLQEAFRSRGVVVVRTRGAQSLRLEPADRPAAIEYVLPILQENDRPTLPRRTERPAGQPMIAMTPEISVRFSETFFAEIPASEAKRKRADQYVGEYGLKVANPPDKPLRIPNAFTLTLAAGEITYARLIEAANRLFEQGRADGLVLYAKPNFLRPLRLQQAPGSILDPRFPLQWHLHNTGQAEGLVDADIDAPEAWRVTEGRSVIRIAIIDDSVQKNHPDLQANFQAGRHYTGASDYDDDPSPRNGRQRHGTACAGIAIAVGNDLGVRGVAPKCGLIGVSIFDTRADQQLADAFYFSENPDGNPATDDGAAVISCSWDLREDVAAPVEVTTAIDELAVGGRRGNGLVILFAAGNYGRAIADSLWTNLVKRESVIGVGATDFRDVRAGYSNYGPELEVVAPSMENVWYLTDPGGFPKVFPLGIDTTDNTDDQPRLSNSDRSGYAIGDYTGTGNIDVGGTGFGGTSAATPLAAGVCGLILSANPNLTATQVRAILEHTCDRVRGPRWIGERDPISYDPTTSHNIHYGYGRVNASKAVLMARELLTNPDAVWPDHVQGLTSSTPVAGQVRLTWKNPPGNVAGVLIVRSPSPIQWKPRDGERYRLDDAVNGMAYVVSVEAREELELLVETAGPTYFAVFAFSADHRYSWGQVAELAATSPLSARPESTPSVKPGSKLAPEATPRPRNVYPLKRQRSP